ncbi:MAG TPA: PrsW family glutamic-type intramembrane protease [Bacteroidales bacterium]|nr:PrsW family glutamic-type intramembrane protease [Bacteroidales bacterium]
MNIVIALLPVVVFLLFLILMDSFKLVKIPYLILCILWGMLCAVGSYFINSFILTETGVERQILSRYIAPAIEETLKMAVILFIIRKGKVGFMIDGAIYGFGVGAGFALIENIWYLSELNSASLLLWTVRGFGTAIMHGGTTSVFSILLMQAFDKRTSRFLPVLYSWLAAILIHSFFNHFVLPPVATMFFTLVIIAVAEYIIFRYSEKNLRKWLELEFDSEVKLLMMIRKGQFARTHAGEYLTSIKYRFSQMAVVDLLAYIALYLELSIKAKSRLMLHEAGLPVGRDESVSDRLAELKALEKNIGLTGILAISPVLRISRRDLWKWSTLR